jgi:hypothetical protein
MTLTAFAGNGRGCIVRFRVLFSIGFSNTHWMTINFSDLTIWPSDIIDMK